MLNNPGLITGAGANPAPGIATGATLEVFLIIANVATAVVAYPVLKRESEMGAIGYVAARLVEATFIAIGIVSALTFVLMRQEATAASNPVLGHVFVSLYYRAFLVGPSFFSGLNGVILGYLMYRSELVPRGHDRPAADMRARPAGTSERYDPDRNAWHRFFNKMTCIGSDPS